MLLAKKKKTHKFLDNIFPYSVFIWNYQLILKIAFRGPNN